MFKPSTLLLLIYHDYNKSSRSERNCFKYKERERIFHENQQLYFTDVCNSQITWCKSQGGYDCNVHWRNACIIITNQNDLLMQYYLFSILKMAIVGVDSSFVLFDSKRYIELKTGAQRSTREYYFLNNYLSLLNIPISCVAF